LQHVDELMQAIKMEQINLFERVRVSEEVTDFGGECCESDIFAVATVTTICQRRFEAINIARRARRK
jgi:hypothetical protein